MDLTTLNLSQEQMTALEGHIAEEVAKTKDSFKDFVAKEDLTKNVQSETDKVRTEYTKKLKDLNEELAKYKPIEKTQEQIEMENRIKALEDKEKEVQEKELQLKASETLENNGLSKQLVKYLNLQGVEDLESYAKEFSEVLTKHINNNKLDNSYKPNSHQATKDVITKEQFTKMSYIERMNLFKTNEELYKKLSK